MAVIYLDDYGTKHFTVIKELWEFNFLKERFSYVKLIEEDEDIESAN